MRDLGGYVKGPLRLARQQHLRQAWEKNPRLLGHANVAYVFDDRKPGLDLGAGIATPFGKGHRLLHVAPRVMYVPDAVSAQDVDDAIRKMERIPAGQGAVVEGIELPATVGATVVPGRVVSESPNRLVAEVYVPGPGVIVIAEAFYPSWEAKVNGLDTEVLPANAMFRAIPVRSAGLVRVEMELSPTGFYIALIPFGLALVLFGVAVTREAFLRIQ